MEHTEVTALPQPPLSAELLLLDRAIQSGRGADEITQLVALARQMQADKARAAFEAAMTKIQMEVPNVIKRAARKDGTANPIRYAPLEDITSAIQPLLGKYGMRLSFSQKQTPSREGWIGIVGKIGHELGHTEEHYLDLPIDQGSKAMNAVQGVGSSYSYACRYLTTRIFNVPIIGEDNNGNGGTLSAAQVGQLQEIINDMTPYKKWKFDLPRFLAVYQAESLEKIPASRFADALGDVKRALNKRQEKEMP